MEMKLLIGKISKKKKLNSDLLYRSAPQQQSHRKQITIHGIIHG